MNNNDQILLGEIGFSQEIINYKEIDSENTLFFPPEYFEQNFEKIFNNDNLKFDIWYLLVNFTY